MVNGQKHCWNLNQSTFTLFIDHSESNLVRKSLIWKVWKLFVNTLTADEKYSLLNRDNLTQPIQMNLSHKQNFFSQSFCAFLKSALNLEHFRNKMTLIADVFPKFRTPKGVVRWMSKKSRFRGPFDRQDGKPAETLLQSQRQHLYNIYSSLWTQLNQKKSLLVVCTILRLFVITLTADG